MSKFNVLLQFINRSEDDDRGCINRVFPTFEMAYEWADSYVSRFPCSASIEHYTEATYEMSELGALL